MTTFSNKNGAKTSKNEHHLYYCENCHYSCSKKFNWERHIITSKHQNATNSNKIATEKEQKGQNEPKDLKLSCDKCNKEFKDRTGLWRHKKKCDMDNLQHSIKHSTQNINKCANLNDITNLTTLICELVKSNTDIHKSVIELCKNGTNNNNTNIINSNNKTFNLQVFLNETCKDAMNISDFIESVKLQLSDLENVGKVGYIEGISNIIIKNLNALDVEKRPVHCTDQKREVMYVKDENLWEKDDEANKKLRKAIRMIAHKNICMLKAFREKYPDCEEYDSNKNSQYNKLVYEAMGGKGDDDYNKDTKIIKKIAKVVGIDKSNDY